MSRPPIDTAWFDQELEDFDQRSMFLAEEGRSIAAEVARQTTVLCAIGIVLVRIAEAIEKSNPCA